MVAAPRLTLIAGGVILLALASAGSPPAQAELWAGFYRSTAPTPPRAEPVPAARTDADTACLSAILQAQELYGIPDNLLLAIGIQEAGRKGPEGLTVWPWTVNANGEGLFFASRREALDWVRAKQAGGVASIDVGCMQINQKWHGRGFDSLDQAFEPSVNVDYAARFLVGLYRDEGDWWRAAGKYHSSTDKHQQRYLASLERNQRAATANLSDFVARTRTDFADRPLRPVARPEPTPPVFWTSAPAGRTAEDGGDRFSIYSNHPIRPVLPRYRDMF